MQNVFDRFGFALFRMRFKQVRHMQKASSLKTNVHESALHPRQNSHHSSQVNVSYQASSAGAFNKQILKNTVA